MEDIRIVKKMLPDISPILVAPKLKVCAYVRVSTGHSEQLSSLQNQTVYYEQKLRTNLEYEFCGVFSDSGISGAKENRPGFISMIGKAKSGGIDLIFTKSISRFARNTVMLLKYVRELKDIGVGVVFEEQKINTLSADGELMLTVLAAIAEEERKSVCTNIRWTVQSRFKRGEVLVDANRLMGYDKDENGRLVPNKEQAKIVRRIYKMYLDGVSAYRIAEQFNEQGVSTYTDKPWSSERILRIISNEKYMGDCKLQKSFVNDNGRQVINQGQRPQYYVKFDHEPIVSRRRWEAAQKIREHRKKKVYPYSGLLRCPYCGAVLIRVVEERGKRVNWVCGTYLQKTKAACKGIRIPEVTLIKITESMMPITEPFVIEEIQNGAKSSKKRTEKNFCLIPASEYQSR